MQKIIILILITLTISCQTTQKKSSESNLVKKSQSIDYSQVSQTHESSTRLKNICNNKLSEKWSQLVSTANSCIKYKNQKKLLLVASKLSLDFPKMPWGKYYKSVYFFNKKMNLKALWLIDNVIKNNNDVGVFRYHKSRILFSLNYLNASKNEALQAISLDVNNFSALLFLAQLELEATHFKKAIGFAKKAEKIKQTTELKLLIGEAYFANKQYKEALVYFDQLKKKNGDIIFKTAYSYEQLEENNKALSFYKQMPMTLRKKYADSYSLDLNEKIKEFETENKKSKNRIPSKQRDQKKND